MLRFASDLKDKIIWLHTTTPSKLRFLEISAFEKLRNLKSSQII